MPIDYVRSTSAKLEITSGPESGKSIHLLWGDRVRVLGTSGGKKRVKVRGREGLVANSDLGGQSLLEIYFIDVGQGDGILIRTPDHRHLMIDGGFPRQYQRTGKNAADFVDWKFHRDYGQSQIQLDAMLCSHNDQDHYGGLWDLLNPAPAARAELGIPNADVRVEAFYHAGLSWWKLNGTKTLGEFVATANGSMFTRLLEDRASVKAALAAGANPGLNGDWDKFFRCVVEARRQDGTPTPIRRLSHADQYLPGFEPAAGAAAIKVLAPVEFTVDGRPAIRRLPGGDSKNTNGNSLLLRLDYGRARVLLTGDLNTVSQDALLRDYAGETLEFQCDVAKACHHGSDDVSYRFLQALRPAVTVISSGDAEGHDHPRPSIVAASATTGHLQITNDKIVSPLIYSTELAQSVNLGRPIAARVTNPDESVEQLSAADLKRVSVDVKVQKAGDRFQTTKTKRLDRSLLVADIVYGLVNVRTDGQRIVCATMNEGNHSWQIKEVEARF